ncbi:MAG: PorT family protein [Bacteroides sp.]|nr:PorT family protein [Bacteroides sp.]
MRISRKVLLAFAILLGSAFGLRAQSHYSSSVSFGVRGGADMSKVFFYPSVEELFNFGATGGVTFRYIEERHFGLIAELNFSQRGWREDFEDAPFKYSRTTNYIQLPILAHIYFGRRGRFFINLGPEFGLYLSQKVNSNFDVNDIENIPDFPVKNRMNAQLTEPIKSKFDYGITAGLGGEFSLNPRNSIYAEARFYYGLGNIMASKRTDPFQTSTQMTLSLALGYWFRVK